MISGRGDWHGLPSPAGGREDFEAVLAGELEEQGDAPVVAMGAGTDIDGGDVVRVGRQSRVLEGELSYPQLSKIGWWGLRTWSKRRIVPLGPFDLSCLDANHSTPPSLGSICGKKKQQTPPCQYTKN